MPWVDGCSAGFVQKVTTDSPFWNTVQREGAALFPATPLVASLPGVAQRQFPQASRSVQHPWVLAGMLWKTRQVSRQMMPPSLSLDITSSCGLRVLVCRGGITFAAASSGVPSVPVGAAGTDVRTLSVRLGPAHFKTLSKATDHALAFAYDCPRRVGTSGAASLVETSNGAIIIGHWSRPAPLLLRLAWSRHAVRPTQSSRPGSG